MTHKRNTGPMLSSTRCGAKSKRTQKPCRAPAVRNKRRCRLHGGAAGSGAPAGNQNAFKTGDYTSEAIQQYREVGRLIHQAEEFLDKLK